MMETNIIKEKDSQEGSLRQLWSLAAFLMLSSLSGMAMMFVDRLMLAKFNLEAHNIVVEAANLGWAFQNGCISLTGIAQVFVAQYHGAGQQQLLSKPSWQMIWFSIFSFLLFIPLAFLFPGWLYSIEIKSSYLFWMLLCVPFYGIYTALCGYFIGQKKPSITVKVILIGNVINFILAYLFIFGLPGLIPSLGSTGAIIATDLALLVQIAILLRLFLKQSKGQSAALDFPLLKKCVHVGFPNALFSVLEALGWALFYSMMATLSSTHLTVAGIVQNVLILSFFFADGLWRAVATLSGNAIGGNRPEVVFKIVRSACLLMTIFCLFLAIFLWSMRPLISSWFLGELSIAEQALIYPPLLFGLANAVVYKYLEGIRLSIGGALTAAGDTKFLLISGSTCIWAFMVLPIYFLVHLRGGSIEQALLLCSFYTLASALIFIWRFRSGKWREAANLVPNHTGLTFASH